MTAGFFLLMTGVMFAYSGFKNVPFSSLIQGDLTPRDAGAFSGVDQNAGMGGSSAGGSGGRGASSSTGGSSGALPGTASSTHGVSNTGAPSPGSVRRASTPALDYLRAHHTTAAAYLKHYASQVHVGAHGGRVYYPHNPHVSAHPGIGYPGTTGGR